MRRVRFSILLIALLLPLIPNGGGAQEIPEFSPPLLQPEDLEPENPQAEAPLSLDEIVPEKMPMEAETLQGEATEAEKSWTSAEQRKEAELDKLFWQLKRSAKADEAEKISRQIQGLWAQSGSDTVDLLMQWAEKAIEEMDWAQAMDFLDNVIMLKPEFAEGWMRRASIHIQRHDLTLAMLDLGKVLQLEPRHYQAMSHLGLVMEMTQRKHAAISIYNQALVFYPQFVRLQKRLDNLLDETTEQSL